MTASKKQSLYLIFGNDDYAVRQAVDKTINDLHQSRDVELERIDGNADSVSEAETAINKCIAALASMGLFASAQTIWLKDASFLADNRTGNSETVKSALDRLADVIKKGLPPDTDLIISAPAIDKRRSFFKACQTAGKLTECKQPEGNKGIGERIARLEQLIKDAGVSMNQEAKAAFIAKTSADTHTLVNEFNKLVLSIEQRTTITLEDVNSMVSVSAETAFWGLATAVADQNLALATQTLHQLIFQRQNMVGLMFNLEKNLRDLVLLKDAMDHGWLSIQGRRLEWSLPPEIEENYAKDLMSDPRKGNPYALSIKAQQAKAFSRKRLLHCLNQAVLAHEKMVSSRVPPELIMEVMLVRMLGTTKGKSKR